MHHICILSVVLWLLNCCVMFDILIENDRFFMNASELHFAAPFHFNLSGTFLFRDGDSREALGCYVTAFKGHPMS